jgi:glycosyltransferase involved in cell wall biosynthesis
MQIASTLHNTTSDTPVLSSQHTVLFLPNTTTRFAEGGLRTRGVFKSNNHNLPLISVVTVVFNGKEHIEDCMKSVLAQTWKNIEYIIIDGGSTDGTLDLLRKYDDKIDYWVSEKDSGISEAFNKGIRCSTGSFIGIINSDDWYEHNALESVATATMKGDAAEIICGRIQYWKQDRLDFEFESDPSRLDLEMTINHPSCFVRYDIYQKWGGFRDRFKYSMDYELVLRFKTKGVKFISLNQLISNMRLNGASDKYWFRALSESRQIKIELLGHPFQAWVYWCFQVMRRIIRDLFLRCGFTSLIRLYRRHFSILKKHESP